MEFVEVTETELELINKLVRMSHDTNADGSQKVETQRDWDFVKYLWEFWKVNQRDHYKSFMGEVDWYRNYYDRNNEFAEMKHEDGKTGKMEMRHMGTLPDTYQMLITRYFPKQDLDNSFFRKLYETIPEIRMLPNNKI